MSSFLSNFKKIFKISTETEKSARQKLIFQKIKSSTDPSSLWEIVGELGDGAFGKVYKARQKDKNTFAALKQVEINCEDDLEDFTVEIDILSDCKHPNIVGLNEAFYFDSKLWMYIEFCEGGALDSIMVDLEKGLTEEQTRYVVHEMCTGLEFLHSRNVIHRDLKAGNVLVTAEGGVKLADFGVSAKNTKTTQRRDTFIGTPYWMAPEVIMCETLKDTPYNNMADIWSLGITMIEFAQIEPPNHDMHPMRVLIKIQKADPPFFDRPSKWTANFRDIVSKCIVKDPEKRLSAADLLQHPFIKDFTSRRALVNLVLEARAEVVEIVDEMDEDEEIKFPSGSISDNGSESFDYEGDKNATLTPTVPLPSDAEIKHEMSMSEDHDLKVDDAPEVFTPDYTEKTPTVPEVPEPHETAPNEPTSPTPPSPTHMPSDDKITHITTQDIKIDEQKPHDISDEKTQVTTEILEEIIDEVIRSTTVQPSIPAVVLDTVQDVVFELKDDDVQQNTDVKPNDVNDNDMIVDDDDNNRMNISDPDDTKTPHKTVIKISSSEEDITAATIIPPPDRYSQSYDNDIGHDISNDIDSSTLPPPPDYNNAEFDHHVIPPPPDYNEDAEPMVTNIDDLLNVTPISHGVDEALDSVANQDDCFTPGPPMSGVVRDNKFIANGHMGNFDGRGVDERLSDTDSERRSEVNRLDVSNPDDDIDQTSECGFSSSNNQMDVHSMFDSQNVLSQFIANGHMGNFDGRGVDERFSDTDSERRSEVNRLDVSNPDDDIDQTSECGSMATVGSGDGLGTMGSQKLSVDGGVSRRRKVREREESKSNYRTIKRTRRFVIDGVVVTSTTSKVVQAGDENRHREEHELRKKDLRELKLLQKVENKQYQDLDYKAQVASTQQTDRFNNEMTTLQRQFDTDLDAQMRQQKQQVERAEVSQTSEMKNARKKIVTEQERELKSFKDYQRQEIKLMKQELDLLPKDARKDVMRKRKEEKDVEQREKENSFVIGQQERMRRNMDQIVEQHREKIAMLEWQFLEQKQHLLRAREAAIWDLEKNQLHEKHQLAKSQLKDFFFLKRHQMLHRHQKELEQMRRINVAKEDEILHRHTEEKKRLPKIQKAEGKTRAQMFKHSLRLSMAGNQDDDRLKIKQFEEAEKKRWKSEQLRQEMKHKKQWNELILRNKGNMDELEQLQAEKRKMLMEHETQKIKELDEQYQNELKEWKSRLQPRKQKLEDEFAFQRNEQSKFYGSAVGEDGGSAEGGGVVHYNSARSRQSTII